MRSGIVQLSYGDSLKLHDAFRLLARDHRAELSHATVTDTRETLVTLLSRSLPSMWTVGRFGLFARLLTRTGRVSELISLATYEQFHQVGDPRELKAVVESASQSPELSSEDRFWALDALVYWEYQEGIFDRIGNLVTQMIQLANESNLDTGALVELSMKQMLVAGITENRKDIDSAYESGLQRIADAPGILKIFRYNYAVNLCHVEEYEEASTLVFDLLMEYFDDLDLDVDDVLFYESTVY